MTPDAVRAKRATVVGGARSGRAVARLLAEVGGEVFLTEQGPLSAPTEAALEAAGVAYECGGHTGRALDADFLVLSPGVPTQSSLVQQALSAGRAVYSEIEVASWFCAAPIVAITGTNGKTTTTRLAGHVVRQALADAPGREVIVAGNIGDPLSNHVLAARPTDVVVLEVSSFQLDHVETFRPRVSVLLNITPDHLGRYDHNFEAYVQAKSNIFRNQGAGDLVVYNRDDDTVRAEVEAAARGAGVSARPLTLDGLPEAGGGLCDDTLALRAGGRAEPLLARDALPLRGRHNVYNALAAAVAARSMGVGTEALREGLAGAEGVPHRLEEVRMVDGVLYVNDSKATNVSAVWYALQSFDRPVVLIAGGRDKGNDYTDLKPLVRDEGRAVVALGESAETVMRELGTQAPHCARAETMEDALNCAQAFARQGDAVLLSPACASFDMYESYEERGAHFRRLVKTLR
jgi:UDP-N-acetylmuramoylalanine--D-glutamate ligase